MSGVGECELVTGHDELGYFADRYGCETIGAVIPSLTTTSEASAGELVALKDTIAEHGAKVIFTSLGTPQAVTEQIAKETGVEIVELATHVMGTATSYAEFMRTVANQIADALK
jgi:zinc/manganese transport system substrate-binding protein